ncbi:MAG: hypothetical protein MK291_07345 [Planctomycetes bacterium]|nr:hypothetical protein [Planctomycetota bacterium]
MNYKEKVVGRSGLKPMGILAFCVVLFFTVAGRVTDGVVNGASDVPEEPLVSRTHVEPTWDVIDRAGRLLATDARLLELSMSPNAMWQGHTPERIAKGLAACLDLERDLSWRPVLDKMIPDASAGVIQVKLMSPALEGEEPRERFMSDAEVRRLDDWLVEGEAGAPVSGMWLQPADVAGRYRLCWMPELLLCEATREAQGYRTERRDGSGHIDRPAAWTRRIASRLAPCLGLGGLDPARARKEVWGLLMPDPYEVVFDRLSAQEGRRVSELLAAEGISEGQMKLSWYRERAYPMAGEQGMEGGYTWLGPWSYQSLQRCEELVLNRHGLSSLAAALPEEQAALRREVRVEATRRTPLSRLEATCKELFERDEFQPFLADPAEYSFLAYRPARGRNQRSFHGVRGEGETPQVQTTIDAHLQNYLHTSLETAVEEHDAALAMGIVIDVWSGEVLAVDGVSQYSQDQFLPLQYAFTPGSTFKPLIAATALDLGVVQAEDRFSTFNRSLHVGNLVDGCRRRPIGEARNSELGADGTLSLREGLAHSVNAVMVQVGLSIPMDNLYSTLINLGYGQRHETELGTTSPGIITPYDRWTGCYTQASVSFGHELMCTLWQHTAALSSIVRGGEWRELHVLRGVSRGAESERVSPRLEHTVFSSEAAHEVREMMRLAARIGTGERFYKSLERSGTPIVFGCKTGTTQKEPKTSCAHLELSCAEENIQRKRDGLPLQKCTEYGRTGTRPHTRDCYTASMVAFGSVGDPSAPGPRAGEEREIMVFVVVDEPRGDLYYGSQIAGPTTMAVLQEALGLTMNGQPLAEVIPDPVAVPLEVSLGLSEDPVLEIPLELEEEQGR